MYKRKGGISAPVLAILTFAVLLVVGVAILMYFYVIAPQATKQSQLSILGEPVIRYSNNKYVLTVTIKNLGSDTVMLQGATIIINDTSFNTPDDNIDPSQIEPGASISVEITWSAGGSNEIPTPGSDGAPEPNHLYTVILQTNYGNFEFSAVFRA